MRIERRFLTDLDYPLLLAVAVLCLFGLLGVYSATSHTDSSLFTAQALRLAIGAAVCVVFAAVDYHRFTDHAPLLYGAALTVLVLTLVVGSEVKGSKSWISLFGATAQPSELAKLVMIIALARYVGDLRSSFLTRTQIAGLCFIFLPPVLLIILQGDLGTAMMYVPIFFGIMLVGGLKLRVILVIVLIASLAAPAGWYLLQDRHRDRIMVTFNPELDPSGVGYQVRQSKIAIGSGGFLGKGIGQGLQSGLGFVPEIQTDFIFALLAEETGFLGAASILLVYLYLLLRICAVADLARDRAGMLIVTGVGSLVFVHVVTNVGMTLGIVPAIGVPLPFVSYGGSSTVTMFAAIGLVLSVRYRRYVY